MNNEEVELLEAMLLVHRCAIESLDPENMENLITAFDALVANRLKG